MNQWLHCIQYQCQRGGRKDIQLQLVTICYWAENTASPIPVLG